MIIACRHHVPCKLTFCQKDDLTDSIDEWSNEHAQPGYPLCLGRGCLRYVGKSMDTSFFGELVKGVQHTHVA